MSLNKIKQSFHSNLKGIYESDEIDSVFFIVLDFVLKKTRFQYTLDPEFEPLALELDQFNAIISRLRNQEPIQYILGETEFFGLKLKLNESVLIPRQETEELIQLILKSDIVQQSANFINILDIGTGSGCIAITLAKHIPNSTISAVDISQEALEIASVNAQNNQVVVDFHHQDIMNMPLIKDNVSGDQSSYDIIVSNPPYVREKEKKDIKPNVLDFEPELALFVSDSDPLVFYRAISEFAVNNLRIGGWLFFEINQYLGLEMRQLLNDFGFKNIEIIKDLFGNFRMAKAQLL